MVRIANHFVAQDVYLFISYTPIRKNPYLSFHFIASFAFVLQMLRAKLIPLIHLCIIRHSTNG